MNYLLSQAELKLRSYWWFIAGSLFLMFLSCSTRDNMPKAAIGAPVDTSVSSKPAMPPPNFESRQTNVNGVNIHYIIGGIGTPLVLIHGFGQNWYMWNKLLPELSKHFTIIAPELPGVGESGRPQNGYDKKTMATDIHELVRSLGFKTVDMAGHDIGLMVAYAYAAQYGAEVQKLALLDAILPGVEPVWAETSEKKWHFGFFERPIAADLVTGHQREFFADFWQQQCGTNKQPFTEDEANEFVRAYSTPGAMAGSFNWYKAFTQDVKDNHELMKHKLQMPVLAMGGEFSAAPILADHIKIVAANVTEIKIAGAGHWLVQEQTTQVLNALTKFFYNKN